MSEDAIPEEMQKVIQEKHPNPFKITYSDNGFLYIGIGYGEQPAGGFGITVNDLYLTENAIYFDTTLLGPSPDSETPASDTASYPYLVIKKPSISMSRSYSNNVQKGNSSAMPIHKLLDGTDWLTNIRVFQQLISCRASAL